MGLAGEGPWALGVMWMLVGLVFLLLGLRLYTRIVCLASYGLDDHIYIVAFVRSLFPSEKPPCLLTPGLLQIFLLIFTIFTHLAGLYGFGQTPDEIGNIEYVVKATLYECIGQGFAIVGMAIAKCSMGFFLLRLVNISWHRIAIWCAMSLVSAASIGRLKSPSSACPRRWADRRQLRFFASGSRAFRSTTSTTVGFQADTALSTPGQPRTFSAVSAPRSGILTNKLTSIPSLDHSRRLFLRHLPVDHRLETSNAEAREVHNCRQYEFGVDVRTQRSRPYCSNTMLTLRTVPPLPGSSVLPKSKASTRPTISVSHP